MGLTKSLIDRASEKCGSGAKLAAMLGISRQLVTDWKNGKSLPTEVQCAQMAELCNVRIEDALLARAEDALSKHPDGPRLIEVMRGGFLRGVAATFVICATLAAAPVSDACQKVVDTLYIVLSRLGLYVRRIPSTWRTLFRVPGARCPA